MQVGGGFAFSLAPYLVRVRSLRYVNILFAILFAPCAMAERGRSLKCCCCCCCSAAISLRYATLPHGVTLCCACPMPCGVANWWWWMKNIPTASDLQPVWMTHQPPPPRPSPSSPPSATLCLYAMLFAAAVDKSTHYKILIKDNETKKRIYTRKWSLIFKRVLSMVNFKV